MANPSLPSFVELMASLGLQDEHAAIALIHGAEVAPQPLDQHSYRQSTASLDSSGTPLSSASLVTPLSSPSVQRDQRERPTSHGKKRYSPYGLSAVTNDIYARRGSVPDMLSQSSYDRRLYHLSAPEPYHDHSGRVTDEDGDEQMEDASSRGVKNSASPLYNTTNTSPTVHCIGQPNLLITRQRMPRPGQPAMPRTKSHSHMRTTSSTITTTRIPTSPRVEMPLDTERTDGDIAVVSISSLLRRSTQQQTRPAPPTISLDPPRGYQFPPVPSVPPPQRPPTTNEENASDSSTTPRRAPPSAPPTKTSFGFLTGAPLSGATSLSTRHRARHARSSSARSVRDMIRERESNVLLAPLHSFHPMSESEEPNEDNHLKPAAQETRIRHRSTGQLVESTTAREVTPPTMQNHSFLPLDDSSRSFSHRRRVKRHTADATTSNPSRSGKRSSPPPPLMLPTLPISINIRALVERGDVAGEKDRLASDTGYVSRREPHSPDPRGSWRRRVAPLEVAGM